jgi:D-serine deaminase-like pyridoxal phosphate-dependent protein
MTPSFTGAAALNQKLLNQPGGRRQLETPALLIDLDRLDRNIATLATQSRTRGLGLRPHAKSHKCARVAARQIAAGANGVSCAKPGELLALFAAGVGKLMLSAPVASAAKIDALARASAEGSELIITVDRPSLLDAYAAAAHRHNTVIGVFVDLDIGLLRSGVATGPEAVALARAAEAAPGLRYLGVQAYEGRAQHIADFAPRRAAHAASTARLRGLLAALADAGLPAQHVSGGGTGSCRLDTDDQVFTELQAGSYIFMDEAYLPIDIDGSGTPVFETALHVALTVIGHSSAGFAILDGGSKSFAVDGPPPRVYLDGREVGRVEWCGDEYGRVLPTSGCSVLPIGTVVECTVPHCDPTLNLHDVAHIVSGDRLIDFWPIDARGRAD